MSDDHLAAPPIAPSGADDVVLSRAALRAMLVEAAEDGRDRGEHYGCCGPTSAAWPGEVADRILRDAIESGREEVPRG